MKLYSATSAHAVIEAFRRMEIEATKREAAAKTLRVAKFHKGEATAWRQAAEMLRNTEFVGWVQK